MMAEDDLSAAQVQQDLFQDPRVHHYWQPEKSLGKLVVETLNLKNTVIAWDIYLLYQPGTRWEGGAFPSPDFWMHQLPEDESLRLDPKILRQQVQVALNNLKS